MKKKKIYKYTATIEFKTTLCSKIKDFREKLKYMLDASPDAVLNLNLKDYKIISIKKSESIKVRSAKNKAVKLQNWVAKMISAVTGLPHGKDEVIQGREMGQSGVDVKLYGDAKEMYPYSVECKNQEQWSVPAWIKQAKDNRMEGTDWQIFCTKNGFDNIMVMDAEAWFDIWEQYLNLLYDDK